jgi:hypothetical protein
MRATRICSFVLEVMTRVEQTIAHKLIVNMHIRRPQRLLTMLPMTTPALRVQLAY